MFSFSFPVQPAFCMTAVSSASQPAKPLVVVGVTYCRGEWGILQTDSVRKIIILMSPVLDAQTAWTDTDKNGWIMLVQKRYSWTKYQFIVLYCPRFNMCLSLCTVNCIGRAKAQHVRITPGMTTPLGPPSRQRSRTLPF